MVIVSHPHSSDLTPCDFFLFQRMNQDLKGRSFTEVAEVKQESLAAFDSISIEDIRQFFQQREQSWDRCIQSQGQYFERDWSFKLVRLL